MAKRSTTLRDVTIARELVPMIRRPPLVPTGSGQTPWEEKSTTRFARIVLRALANMAAHTGRQPVDLDAALRRAGLSPDPARLRAALMRLRQDGCIADEMPTPDGGMLLIVTAHGMGPSVWKPR